MLFFFFNDTATTEIYTLSLHDALPIYFRFRIREREDDRLLGHLGHHLSGDCARDRQSDEDVRADERRSEEHTSELQSQSNLVCRLLLEKKFNQLDVSSSLICISTPIIC